MLVGKNVIQKESIVVRDRKNNFLSHTICVSDRGVVTNVFSDGVTVLDDNGNIFFLKYYAEERSYYSIKEENHFTTKTLVLEEKYSGDKYYEKKTDKEIRND
jgi:hypothetical protein